MKQYIIGRMEKIKNVIKLEQADRHNNRDKKYSICGDNIDNDLTELNQHFEFFGFQQNAVDTYIKCLSKLKKKPRKDHVHALELFFGYSPSSDVDVEDFKSKVIDYMKKTFEGCPFSVDLHLDEKTPHIHAIVIPCKEKGGEFKFCASDWCGKKSDLSRFQKEIYEEIGVHFGLSRGREGSKDKHKKIKDYYEEQNQQQIEEYERIRLENEKIHQQMVDEYNHKIEVLEKYNNSLDAEINKYKYEEDHNKLLEFQKMILEYIDMINKEIETSNDETDISIFKKCLELLMTLLRKHKLIKDKEKSHQIER